ncbi:MAG TPA: tetratricopeptide repeat protein [Bryobacteraceae bacterium]|nr:tetratricopeptide repeat protein [Bryobacteraceae bacterium]
MLPARSNVADSSASECPTEAIRGELGRILRDPEFAATPRSGAFLTHVVERTLAGRQSEIKESTIGVEVFQRPADYDTRTDSIVRTEARRLREKLSHYYLHAGKDDPLLIEIPKGVYVPVFRSLQPAVEPPVPAAVPQPNPARRVMLGATVLFAGAMLLTGWRVLGRWPVAASQSPRVLAVLPFEDLDDPGGQTRYLSVGIAEDLERDLSQVPGLRLHAPPPAEWLAPHREVDYPALARRLGANVLLTGAILPGAAGRQVRASLIRGGDGSILWTDHFPLGIAALAVDREIEAGASRALAIQVPALKRPPENPKAHDLFLQGRNLWARRTRESAEQAIELFRQALAVDPNYALAYMGIADAYVLTAANGQMPIAAAVREGEAAASKAIALDPTMAEAHAALGLLKGIEWDCQDAAAEYARAIALDPSYDRAYVRLGTLRFSLGDFAGAEKLMREAETLNPYSTALPMIRAELYYYARRYQDAIDLSRQVLHIEPGNAVADMIIARTFLAMRKPDEALAEILHVAKPSDFGVRRADFGSFLAAAGRRREGLAMLDQVVRDRSRDYVDSYDLAVAFARTNDRQRSIAWIENALAERSPNLSSARWDPVFDFLRSDPRFAAAMRQVPSSTYK